MGQPQGRVAVGFRLPDAAVEADGAAVEVVGRVVLFELEPVAVEREPPGGDPPGDAARDAAEVRVPRVVARVRGEVVEAEHHVHAVHEQSPDDAAVGQDVGGQAAGGEGELLDALAVGGAEVGPVHAVSINRPRPASASYYFSPGGGR